MHPRTSALLSFIVCLFGVTFAQQHLDVTLETADNLQKNGNNVSDSNGNGHEDHWSSLTADQQQYILYAYFASNVPSDIQFCDRAEECPSTTRCDETWKLCAPKESPHFPKTDGFCGKDSDCKPMYRCGNNKCHLTGPLACKSQSDCLVIPGLEFTCVERPQQVPGKRCWRKCSITRDCLECDQAASAESGTTTSSSSSSSSDDLSACRIPQPFIHTLICQDHFCSKNQTAIV